jgi:AcrR family transcriptional regulator
MASESASRPRTRDRILDAALDLFASEGFGGTTITAVERRVGLTAGTGSFYRHFPSKEELLRAVVEREVTRCVTAIEEEGATLPEVDDPEEQRAAMLDLMLRGIRRFDRLFRLMVTEGDRVPAISEAITKALQGPTGRLVWEENPHLVVAIAALGGYHVFGLVQGGPFQGVAQDDFVRTLAAMTTFD